MSTVTINGTQHDLSQIDPSTPLLWVLRDNLDLAVGQPGPGAEEPEIDRLVRQPGVEGTEAVRVCGPDGANVCGATVREDDIGFPVGRIV